MFKLILIRVFLKVNNYFSYLRATVHFPYCLISVFCGKVCFIQKLKYILYLIIIISMVQDLGVISVFYNCVQQCTLLIISFFFISQCNCPTAGQSPLLRISTSLSAAISPANSNKIIVQCYHCWLLHNWLLLQSPTLLLFSELSWRCGEYLVVLFIH